MEAINVVTLTKARARLSTKLVRKARKSVTTPESATETDRLVSTSAVTITSFEIVSAHNPEKLELIEVLVENTDGGKESHNDQNTCALQTGSPNETHHGCVKTERNRIRS